MTTLLYYILGGVLGMTRSAAVDLCRTLPIGVPSAGRLSALSELFRNTPLLVQLIWIHFALPGLAEIRMTIFQSGLVALTLNASGLYE